MVEIIAKTQFVPPPAGTWRPVISDGKRTAVLACPKCGARGTLRDHEIAGNGTVTPSVVCPNECGFHDYVRLEGWCD